MSHRIIPTNINYEKVENAAAKALIAASKGSKNPLLKAIAKEESVSDKENVQKNIRKIQMLVNEAVEAYEDGEFSFEETIDHLVDALEDIE